MLKRLLDAAANDGCRCQRWMPLCSKLATRSGSFDTGEMEKWQTWLAEIRVANRSGRLPSKPVLEQGVRRSGIRKRSRTVIQESPASIIPLHEFFPISCSLLQSFDSLKPVTANLEGHPAVIKLVYQKPTGVPAIWFEIGPIDQREPNAPSEAYSLDPLHSTWPRACTRQQRPPRLVSRLVSSHVGSCHRCILRVLTVGRHHSRAAAAALLRDLKAAHTESTYDLLTLIQGPQILGKSVHKQSNEIQDA